MCDVTIRPFTLIDYDNALALRQQSEGVGLSSADEKPVSPKRNRESILAGGGVAPAHRHSNNVKVYCWSRQRFV